MLQPRRGVRERGKGGEVGGRSKWNKQLLAERRGEGQEGKLCSGLQVPKPSHTVGAELELVPPGREKRRTQGNRQQLEGWTARMEGRPKAAGQRKRMSGPFFCQETRLPVHASPS